MSALAEAVILLGSGGFIGRNLVEALRGRAGTLIGVTGRGLPTPGCDRTVTLDGLDDLPALPADTVLINVAAYRYDAARFREEQSVILERNLAIAGAAYAFCVRRGITEVRQAGSSAVYPAGSDIQDDAVPVDLNRPPNAGEAGYAWSRRFAEVMAGVHRDLYGIHTQTFRLSNPFGPFDSTDEKTSHVAAALIIRALTEEGPLRLLGNPDAERDFVFSGDVAAVFAASCRRRGLHDTWNLAQGRTVSIRRFAETVLAAAGLERPIAVADTLPAGVNLRRPTGERLAAAFPEVALRPLADGLAESIPWYRRALEAEGRL